MTFVDELQLQLGQLCGITCIRVGVGAENDCFSIWLFAIVGIAVTRQSNIRRCFLSTAVIRGVAGLFDNTGSRVCILYGIARIHGFNWHTVFINCPGRVKQGRVGVLGHGQVAAPAELVTERNDFLILQRELAFLVNRTRFSVDAGAELGIFCRFQIASFCRAVIRDFILLGGKAGDLFEPSGLP